MTGRAAAWLAWTSFVASVVLHVVGWALTVVAEDTDLAFDAVSGVPLVLLPAVGAVVASRRPANAIGWLFCAAGLLLAVADATYGWAAYASGPPLAGATAAAWVTSWVFLPAVFGVPPLLFLLFPEGRALDRRWGMVVAGTLAGLVLLTAGQAVAPGELQDAPVAGVENPVGVDLAPVRALAATGWAVVLAGIVLGGWSLVVRYRRSRGEQRLQMRWFASAAVLFALACLVSAALHPTRYAGVGQATIVVAFSLLPLATAVAILRHRLYDIDVVINRTLVYGALTATLAAVYLGSVLLLQLVLSPLTETSDVAVAVSTLAAAAAFRPARHRIQAVVDRRFFRTRYDAARTVASFSRALREEVDLDSVSAGLRRVVRDAVQPSCVSVWLKDSP